MRGIRSAACAAGPNSTVDSTNKPKTTRLIRLIVRDSTELLSLRSDLTIRTDTLARNGSRFLPETYVE